MDELQRYLSHPENRIHIARDYWKGFSSDNEPHFAQKCLESEYRWLALAEDFDKTEHF